jgi:multidrug resistance protein, MATE family
MNLPYESPAATESSDDAVAPLPRWPRGPGGVAEVLRVSIPLMISTGCLSVVLFVDRTLLLKLDGASMSAALAAGNLFWSLICLPLGIASMTGAFVAQYVGVGRPEAVGRLLWQAIFLSIATTPLWVIAWIFARQMFIGTGQASELLELETVYLRVLMFGAVGGIIESALSGFFSGTHRTMAVMWINVASALLNLVLDVPLIFGFGTFEGLGIVGAGLASVISFWFKAIAYAALILKPSFRRLYQLREGMVWDAKIAGRLLFFGLPAGLQYLAEAGAFTVIVLQIGQLGDMPLQATTMAINFNMIAFVPLMGVSIGASVLVGQHLTRNGSKIAARAAFTSLLIGMCYSIFWATLYLGAPEFLMNLYRAAKPAGDMGISSAGGLDQTEIAIQAAILLLQFVAAYVILDSIQLIMAGVLRGAGDTWFVLAATSIGSIVALAAGLIFEPQASSAEVGLRFWWYVITGWVWLLAIAMSARFFQGRWKDKRLVEREDSVLPID